MLKKLKLERNKRYREKNNREQTAMGHEKPKKLDI